MIHTDYHYLNATLMTTRSRRSYSARSNSAPYRPLMRHIAQEVTAHTSDNFVLKGGTALLLAYGMPRFSTDLDFDG